MVEKKIRDGPPRGKHGNPSGFVSGKFFNVSPLDALPVKPISSITAIKQGKRISVIDSMIAKIKAGAHPDEIAACQAQLTKMSKTLAMEKKELSETIMIKKMQDKTDMNKAELNLALSQTKGAYYKSQAERNKKELMKLVKRQRKEGYIQGQKDTKRIYANLQPQERLQSFDIAEFDQQQEQMCSQEPSTRIYQQKTIDRKPPTICDPNPEGIQRPSVSNTLRDEYPSLSQPKVVPPGLYDATIQSPLDDCHNTLRVVESPIPSCTVFDKHSPRRHNLGNHLSTQPPAAVTSVDARIPLETETDQQIKRNDPRDHLAQSHLKPDKEVEEKKQPSTNQCTVSIGTLVLHTQRSHPYKGLQDENIHRQEDCQQNKNVQQRQITELCQASHFGSSLPTITKDINAQNAAQIKSSLGRTSDMVSLGIGCTRQDEDPVLTYESRESTLQARQLPGNLVCNPREEFKDLCQQVPSHSQKDTAHHSPATVFTQSFLYEHQDQEFGRIEQPQDVIPSQFLEQISTTKASFVTKQSHPSIASKQNSQNVPHQELPTHLVSTSQPDLKQSQEMPNSDSFVPRADSPQKGSHAVLLQKQKMPEVATQQTLKHTKRDACDPSMNDLSLRLLNDMNPLENRSVGLPSDMMHGPKESVKCLSPLVVNGFQKEQLSPQDLETEPTVHQDPLQIASPYTEPILPSDSQGDDDESETFLSCESGEASDTAKSAQLGQIPHLEDQ